MLSGIRDLDYKILNDLDDKDLVNFCQTSKQADEYCNDENYWLNRIIYKFNIPIDILKKYKRNRSWSDYYIYDLRSIDNNRASGTFAVSALEGRLDHVMIFINKMKSNPSFLNKMQNISPLNNAALGGHLEVVKYLVENGFQPTSLALMWSSQNGHLNVVKYLVEKGVNVNTNYYGDTPLSLAKQNNHTDIVEYLIGKGAKN